MKIHGGINLQKWTLSHSYSLTFMLSLHFHREKYGKSRHNFCESFSTNQEKIKTLSDAGGERRKEEKSF